jgi:hypothetical protein
MTDTPETALAKAKALIEERLAETLATDAVAKGNFPFGMDGDEGRIYLSGKADALQWALEMLPSSKATA